MRTKYLEEEYKEYLLLARKILNSEIDNVKMDQIIQIANSLILLDYWNVSKSKQGVIEA